MTYRFTQNGSVSMKPLGYMEPAMLESSEKQKADRDEISFISIGEILLSLICVESTPVRVKNATETQFLSWYVRQLNLVDTWIEHHLSASYQGPKSKNRNIHQTTIRDLRIDLAAQFFACAHGDERHKGDENNIFD